MADWNAPTAARILRERRTAVLAAWDDGVRLEIPELAPLSSGALHEPVDAIIVRLAEWFAGDAAQTATLWTVVADHACQRNALGLPLGALLREYARLRVCMHAALAELSPLTTLDRVLDLAAVHAADHYVTQREEKRGHYIGMLAHDLRTPLSCVVMACDLLALNQLPERQRALVDRISDSADRMQHLVTEVLGRARGDREG